AISRGHGYNLFITPTSAVLTLDRNSTQTDPALGAGLPTPPPDANNTVTQDVLALNFAGANPDAQVIGLNELASRTNYFLGDDPSQWHTDVPNYDSIKIVNLYDGIDAVFHPSADGSKPEYDFIVHPGADPSQIRLSVQGADVSLSDT